MPDEIKKCLEKLGGIDGILKWIPSYPLLKHESKIFGSLSEPLRLKILYACAVRPLCVCVIKRIVKVSDSKLSYHLSALKRSGLLRRRAQGNFLIYEITDLGRELLEK